ENVAATRPIELELQKIDGQWLISNSMLGVYDDDSSDRPKIETVQEQISQKAIPVLDFSLDTANDQQMLAYMKEVDDWIHDVFTIPVAELQVITEADKEFMHDHLNNVLSEEVISERFTRL